MSSISGLAASAVAQQATHTHRGGGRQGLRDQLKQFAAANGIEGESYVKLQQQVDDAAKAAAESGGNPRESIKAAVSQVLKDNGLDPAAFDAQIKRNRPQGRPEGAPPPGRSQGPGGPASVRQQALARLLESRDLKNASSATAAADDGDGDDDALEAKRGFAQTGTLVDTQA